MKGTKSGLNNSICRILLYWIVVACVVTGGGAEAIGGQVILSWDSNPTPAVAGYRVYMGTAGGVYSSSIDVGNTTNVTIGGLITGQNYYFAVTAYDSGGMVSRYSNEIFKSATEDSVDLQAPTVNITAPLGGANVAGSTVSVSASAVDDVAVVGVQFKLDGIPLGAEAISTPYTVIWDSTSTANGAYTLTATARDTAGNSTTSSTVGVTVNNLVTPVNVYFREGFDDASLTARGWYDSTTLKLSPSEHIAGSVQSVEYHFPIGATVPETSGAAIRRKFMDSDSVYIGYFVKHSSNWIGSNRPYHPHEFMLMTNLESNYWGPSTSHLTVYIEENAGKPVLVIQDALNIDQTRIRQDLSATTEQRAVAGCNGYTQSDGSEPEDCYLYGTAYRNNKTWRTGSSYFQDVPGAYYKGDWHHIEAYFKLNSVADSKGVADGILRYWYDGNLVVDRTNVLFRTGQYPSMKFNQLIIAPFIGDGSPVDQTLWIDELMVADSKPVGPQSPKNLTTR